MKHSTRFVILRHDHPLLHWDLMLEDAGKLRTWRLPDCPTGPGEFRAEPIADHRLEYLDYEGPVSGGRGSVERFDHGLYQMQSVRDDELSFRFRGSRLSGPASLCRDDSGEWTLIVAAADETDH